MPQSKRRAARELALHMLFSVDVGRVPLREVLNDLMEDRESPSNELLRNPAVQEHARRLVRGTAAHVKEIDQLLASRAEGWELERLASVDRNLLRLAAYELLYEPGVPEGVAINEAVDLAKIYGTDESGKFVNGLLGTLARDREAILSGAARQEAVRDESGSVGRSSEPEG